MLTLANASSRIAESIAEFSGGGVQPPQFSARFCLSTTWSCCCPVTLNWGHETKAPRCSREEPGKDSSNVVESATGAGALSGHLHLLAVGSVSAVPILYGEYSALTSPCVWQRAESQIISRDQRTTLPTLIVNYDCRPWSLALALGSGCRLLRFLSAVESQVRHPSGSRPRCSAEAR